jgi:tyrosinase
VAVRKNISSATPDERRRLVDSVLALKANGGYDSFVDTHNTFVTNDGDDVTRWAHRCPSFLPWHRRFLLEFERQLQRIDPLVSLMYWDWTVDQSTSALPWTAEFMGGDGNQDTGMVATGPFAYGGGRWTQKFSATQELYLTRGLGGRLSDSTSIPLPATADVDAALSVATYDSAPWNSQSTGSFRNQLEGWLNTSLHNAVHVWVDGDMGSGYSPNDPIFWLHHCNIDRLWSRWQDQHPTSGYLPVSKTTNVVALNDRMRPWNDAQSTPKSLLDWKKWYTYG